MSRPRRRRYRRRFACNEGEGSELLFIAGTRGLMAARGAVAAPAAPAAASLPRSLGSALKDSARRIASAARRCDGASRGCGAARAGPHLKRARGFVPAHKLGFRFVHPRPVGCGHQRDVSAAALYRRDGAPPAALRLEHSRGSRACVCRDTGVENEGTVSPSKI